MRGNAGDPYRPRVILDRASPVPLYHQIASVMEEGIRSGEVVDHTRIENELDLAHRLGVSRPTARKALQSLVDKGMLIRKRGVGTEVAPEVIRRALELTSLYDDLVLVGRRPETELLAYEIIEAPGEVAQRMLLRDGEEVARIERLRSADGDPLALMTNYVCVDIVPGRTELLSGGLYQAFRAAGIKLRHAHQVIGARVATQDEVKILGGEPGSAVLTMERTVVDVENRVVELGRHIYLASRYQFETSLVIH